MKDRGSFLFTQQSLTTFENCPLKFKKRYIENLKWDNIYDESKKKSIERGKNFHLLAQRYFLGMDVDLHEQIEEHIELMNWIGNLKKVFPINKGIRYLPEYKLRLNTSILKLEANFDLLLIRGDKVQIWDWKTHSAKLGKNQHMGERLLESYQTIIYLFILKEEIELLLGKKIQTNNVSMHYWQPYPAEIEAEIIYSNEMHENFRIVLESKIKSIYEYDYNRFDKNQFHKHCKKCEFNWLCNKEIVDFLAFSDEDEYFEESDK